MALLATLAIPVMAQTRTPGSSSAIEADDFDAELRAQQQAQSQSSMPLDQAGHLASSSNGQTGERLSRDNSAPNLYVTGRINNRIQNRVQNRIRNRIDRYYDPQGNATSPFAVASDDARAKGKSSPR